MIQTLALREPKKHSVRYDAEASDQNPIVSSIYISKVHLRPPYPAKINLRIEIPVERLHIEVPSK